MLAGNGNNCGLPWLDLLNGIQVQYESNVAAAQVAVDTNAELQIVQMTTGCALAFVMDETMQIGICFTCTNKNNPNGCSSPPQIPWKYRGSLTGRLTSGFLVILRLTRTAEPFIGADRSRG